MNELGMIVDITHISRQAMRDVLETSTRPVLNSHTALKSISHRIPALTEEEIRALADQGGVIALHFMTHMLTGRFSPQADLDEVLAQVDAIVKVGGIDCLALGPDYLPYTQEHKRNTKQPNLSFPVGLESPAKMLNLTRALVSTRLFGGRHIQDPRRQFDAPAARDHRLGSAGVELRRMRFSRLCRKPVVVDVS